MKKWVSLVLAFVLAAGCLGSASAAYYQQHQSNEATFETLEEAHANAPGYLSAEYTDRAYIADPALDDYPQGTTYVYRSPGIYNCVSAANRMNTNLLVYTDEQFAGKDDALNYLKGLGLTDMADEATGSVVLVTPIDPEAGFGQADQYAYFQLQSAMCNIGYSVSDDNGTRYYADAGYFGGLTYRYLIGIEGGATFINDYVASNLDYISRIAGLLLVGGEMEKIREVAASVPVWLVNADEAVAPKYAAANETDSNGRNGSDLIYYNQAHPLQQVIVTEDENADLADMVHRAYYDLFITAMRIPVVKANLYTASTLYSDYKWNQAPYSLADRNPIINGVTPDGIHVVEHQEERFSDYKAANGEYVTTWYEFLPEEVLNNTADEHSIPLLLCNHGGGDDPVQAVDELGWLKLAGEERIAIIAQRHTSEIPGSSIFDGSPFDTMSDVLPQMVRYMLETYPALDPSRVYATGYSMGGAATVETIEWAPQLFAAAVPMAAGSPSGIYAPTEEQAAAFDTYNVAMMFTTSEYDLPSAMDQQSHTIGEGYRECINRFAVLNGLGELNYDFESWPFVGFEADRIVTTLLNGEYENTTWYLNNEADFPVLAVSYTELLPHGLHPEYGTIAWEFMRHYSRNTETGELIYTP